MSSSTEYERLVQSAMRVLLVNDLGPEAAGLVQHNVSIPGRSGCLHQIDVYWKVTIGTMDMAVAIECKHYKNRVELGQVRDFYGVLVDTKMNGMMVTTKGYQSGARVFADHYGINIIVLKD